MRGRDIIQAALTGALLWFTGGIVDLGTARAESAPDPGVSFFKMLADQTIRFCEFDPVLSEKVLGIELSDLRGAIQLTPVQCAQGSMEELIHSLKKVAFYETADRTIHLDCAYWADQAAGDLVSNGLTVLHEYLRTFGAETSDYTVSSRFAELKEMMTQRIFLALGASAPRRYSTAAIFPSLDEARALYEALRNSGSASAASFNVVPISRGRALLKFELKVDAGTPGRDLWVRLASKSPEELAVALAKLSNRSLRFQVKVDDSGVLLHVLLKFSDDEVYAQELERLR